MYWYVQPGNVVNLNAPCSYCDLAVAGGTVTTRGHYRSRATTLQPIILPRYTATIVIVPTVPTTAVNCSKYGKWRLFDWQPPHPRCSGYRARWSSSRRSARRRRSQGQRRRRRRSRTVWKSTGVSGAPDHSSPSHFSATTRQCWQPVER